MDSIPRYRVPMMNNRLLVIPKDPPPELLGNYDPRGTEYKKPGPAVDNTQLQRDPYNSSYMQKSLSGKVEGGIRDAYGFINTESTSKRAQKDALDEDTLDVWNRSRLGVMESNQRRQKLLEEPLSSDNPPDMYTTTYQRSHRNLLPAVQNDVADLVFKDNQIRALAGRAKKSMGDGHSTGGATEYALQYRHRDADMADKESLKARNKDSQKNGLFVSQNGNAKRVEDRVISPTRSMGHVAPLSTTSGSTYGAFDPITSFDQSRLPDLNLSEEEQSFILRKQENNRTIDPYITTHSESYTAKNDFVDSPDTRFRKSHYFVKKNGVMGMQRGHDPELRQNNFQETERTADIVPGHFTTRSMINNGAFRSFY